jgi:hypothetical protein
VAEQEPAEPVAGPGEVLDHVPSSATEVTHAFLGRRRDGDRGELAAPVESRQSPGIPTVGLHPIAGTLRDEGGCDHIAAHPHGGEQALEVVAGGAAS